MTSEINKSGTHSRFCGITCILTWREKNAPQTYPACEAFFYYHYVVFFALAYVRCKIYI